MTPFGGSTSLRWFLVMVALARLMLFPGLVEDVFKLQARCCRTQRLVREWLLKAPRESAA